MSLLKRFSKAFRVERMIQSWGAERAVVDFLSEEDARWIQLRYRIAGQAIEKSYTVLDAACGSGHGSEVLAEKAGRVVGIDISPQAVKYANQRHAAANVTYLTMDVTSMSFQDSSFDYGVGIETIEHLEDVTGYLSELKRVVRPGGRIVISTPRRKSEKPDTPFHVREYVFEEFLAELGEYFVIDRVYGLYRTNQHSYKQLTDDHEDADMFVAICINNKYVLSDYDSKYYSDLEGGMNANPVTSIMAADLAAVIQGSDVLSIGCGTGVIEEYIKTQKPNIKLIGTDVAATEPQRELWQKRGLEVLVADGPSQPFEDNSFDTVYSSHVLEHVPDPKAVIIESLRLARLAAVHMVPVNLANPDHINFFKFGDIDNEYRTQEATIDLKILADEICEEARSEYPNIDYVMTMSNPRDGSRDYGDIEFTIKRPDRLDGMMPCFIVSFYKDGRPR
jgi:ubiquinone/menaquinone biosynthesis C-methylase UbiE